MAAPSNAQLGAAIRSLRQSRNLSIERLAADADIHRTYLSMIERGIHSPSWRVIGQLADQLEVEISDLAKLAAEMPA